MSRRQSARKAQNEPVPQWVRDFIASREQQRLEEHRQRKSGREEQASDNTYLLCPFDHDEVEAIRNGVRVLKEEAFLDDIQKNRKSRKAGQFVPDSGFSLNDNFTFKRYFRQLLHTPLSRQQMQEVVVKYYGWGKWSEDPWGGFSKFCEWLNSISDDERDVWAINETFGGRVYLALWILEHLSRYNYSKITAEDLLTYIGQGAENFLLVKTYAGWDDFNYHYPKEPLPTALVNKEIIKVYLGCPFRGFRWFVNSIYLWYFALNEAKERAKEDQALQGLLDYSAATDIQIAELCRKLAPKGYQLPDVDEAWQRLEESVRKGIAGIAKKFEDVYPLQSEHHDTLTESYVEAQEKLHDVVIDMKTLPPIDFSRFLFPLSADDIAKITSESVGRSKLYDAAIKGLKGYLGRSLLRAVKNDFIDADEKAHRKHEVTESQIDATRVTDEGGATPFLDTIPGRELPGEEPIDLRELNLLTDELTPRELWVLKDVYQGLNDGYRFASKQDNSFRDRWGKDYDKNIKAFNRMKVKLKNI